MMAEEAVPAAPTATRGLILLSAAPAPSGAAPVRAHLQARLRGPGTAARLSRGKGFVPASGVLSAVEICIPAEFSPVAREQIFPQITSTILFTDPHRGPARGKVAQLLLSHSPPQSRWTMPCWHGAPALALFVPAEAWGQFRVGGGGVACVAFVLQNKQKTAFVNTKEKPERVKKSIHCRAGAVLHGSSEPPPV